MSLTTKRRGDGSALDRFRTSGATKVAFPRRGKGVEGIIINTAGGLTGGDRFAHEIGVGPGSQLTLTSQAAERAYRSDSGPARVTTRLRVAEKARLHWLPQELIIFDRACLDRRMEIDLASDAELVLTEPVVFGRHAMGETAITATFRDRVAIRRDGRPLLQDRIDLSGDITARLARPAIANGMAAMATAIYHGPRAETLADAIRPLLPGTGGISHRSADVLTIRLLAPDAFLMRKSLILVLERLTGATLPKSWSL